MRIIRDEAELLEIARDRIERPINLGRLLAPIVGAVWFAASTLILVTPIVICVATTLWAFRYLFGG